MNPVAEEMLYLMHYGMPRRSGRYPYGSGKDPYQHSNDFLGRVEEMRKAGTTYIDPKTGKKYTGDTAIAKTLGLSTGQFRTELALANDERKAYRYATAKSMAEDGKGPTEIGKALGLSESTVRGILANESYEVKTKKAQETADFLKARVEECMADGGMIDVSVGTELELNISREKMKQALYLLEREGYHVYRNRFEQVTNEGQFTTQSILCPPGTPYKNIYQFDKIHSMKEYISRDGGKTFEKKFHYPASLDSSRVKVLLHDEVGPDGETGVMKDGLIQIRRGVPDLSLGDSRYSQVRILVDGDKYLKGMAVYSDNMPDGIDVIFNSNKKSVDKAYKKITDDPDNPFGSAIKDSDQGGQYWYDADTGKRCSANDPNVKNKKLGLINKRADEGDWSDWKDALPSQFLAKQSKFMVKKQLDLAKADKMAEYEAIMELNNPTIKKHYLDKFASSCDSAAVHLQGAALPGQKYHVIVPINSLKENEVYAPRYDDGTKLALIRYPHGGTFEIPILTVNNKNKVAKDILGSTPGDGIGICKKVADRLSGADFDGDTVMCIPTHDPAGKVKVTARPKNLEGLEGFDPIDTYGPDSYKGRKVPIMTEKYKQIQMGVVSNLITDMTLAGANDDELAAAVRHSMVVIDAVKHKLDYRQSAIDNNIAALHKNYQGRATGGAATILSRAKGQAEVPKRQGSVHVNQKGKPWYDPTKPEGAKIYNLADDLYYERTKVNKRTGEVTTETKMKTQKTTKMDATDDAYTLLSEARHPVELMYADYANSMKALANKARKEMVYTKELERDKTAAKVYSKEVKDLEEKVRVAKLNKTRERAAGRMAYAEIKSKEAQGILTSKEDITKAGQKALTKYREEYGSVRRRDRAIQITDREWEAIQAGAISKSMFKDILNNADADSLRQRAMPKTYNSLGPAKVNKIKQMANSNFTLSDIAEACDVSVATVEKYLKGGK